MIPNTNVVIVKQGFKYYIIDNTGMTSRDIPNPLPYPDNFPSTWSYHSAMRIKSALEDSFKHGWMTKYIEEINKE